MDHEEFEKQCDDIRKGNEKLLRNFRKWLKNKNLGETTVKKHVGNVDFYINSFLLHEEAVEAKDGAGSVNGFLGYWFIRKAMWSSVTSIKENASSLKKFYTYLHEVGIVEKSDLEELKETIKENMDHWLNTMEHYLDDDFDWLDYM